MSATTRNRPALRGHERQARHARAVACVALALLAPALTGCAATRLRRSILPPGLSDPRPVIREEHATAIDPPRVALTREYLRLHQPEVLATLPAGDGPAAIALTPRVVLVHYTAIPTLEETLATFAPLEIAAERELVRRNGLLNVGIHFVVDRDGTIYRLYPETVIARHVIGLNHVAIGIENVGDGDLDERGARAPLTRAQLAANVALVRHLAARHPSLRFLVGHHEYRRVEDPRHPAHDLFVEAVAGYRTEKRDPGPRFLRRLRRELRQSSH
jgi:N-acetylmuramoyl-L-alanine amidase